MRTGLWVAMVALLAAPAPMIEPPAQAQSSSETLRGVPGYRQVAVRLAPGIHVLHQAEPFQPSPIGNVTVVEQSDGLLLVDSGGSRGDGERVVALVKGISSKPVKRIVLTHWHNDHPLGLAAIKAAWPEVEIIAHRKTRDHIAEGRIRGLPFAPDSNWEAEQIKTFEIAAAEFRQNAEKRELSIDERRGWAELADLFLVALEDERGTYVVRPTSTFDDKRVLSDPIAPAELLYLGRANTDGDTVVWLPKQRVLIAGDTVVAPVPYGFNVFPAEWIEVLRKMKGYDFAVLVPGHGLPQQDKSYLDALIASMTDIRAQIASLAAQGLTLEQARERANFELHKRAFAGTDAWRRYWFERYWLNPFTQSVFKEAKGEPLGPAPLASK